MDSNELGIPASSLQQFNEDTALISESMEEFIQEVYPYFFADNDLFNGRFEKYSTALIKKIKFFRIDSCTIEETDSFFEYLNNRIKKLLSVVYSMNVPVCFGIIGRSGNTSLVLGIDPIADNSDTASSVKKILQGLLPDISISDYRYEENGKTSFGIIGGAPSYVIEGSQQSLDYSSLIRGLNGKEYTLLVMAKPVGQESIQTKINSLTQIKNRCLMVSKRNISLQQSDAHTTGTTKSTSTTDTDTDTNSVSSFASFGFGPFFHAGGSVGHSHSHSHSVSESISKSASDTFSKGKSLGLEIQNDSALDLVKRAENALSRLKKGCSTGFWQSAICFSTNDEFSMKILQGCLYSEIAKPDPLVLPPQLIPCNNIINIMDKNQSLIIPQDILNMKGNSSPALCFFANTEELSLLFALPDKNVPGYELKTGIRYPVSPPQTTFRDFGSIELGSVCDGSNKLENVPFLLSPDDLNKHTFVCGITGSGKTNTVKNILIKTDRPFWVIECAKKEYRKLDFKDKNKAPVVFTLGIPEINCISFNPFYIMQGISPQMHIDYLKDLFNASFSFYGPMPYILEKCLHEVYLKKGWNLSMGYHPHLANTRSIVHLFDSEYMAEQYSRDEHKYLFPTMYDLKDEIEIYVKNMGYEGELSSNIKTAILVRLESLCVGAKGYMLNTNETPEFASLLNKNVVFELEGLADDSDKAFAVGILIIYLTEYRMYEKEISQDSQTKLKHLLVIEEAHRLLKNISTEKISEDMDNPKGKAIEHFTNMIAEMRSYGQGVIISEQIPTKIAPDVIKNSSNKIIHRIVAKDDQAIIANMIGMDDNDAIYLGNQLNGRALCHTEGMRLPVPVAFPKVTEIDRKDGDIRRQTTINEKRDLYMLKSLLRPCLLDIDDEILRLLNSFLTLNEDNIKGSIAPITNKDNTKNIAPIKKKSRSAVRSKDPRLLKERQYEEAEAAIISELLIKYLFSGYYYTEKLPENLMEKIKNAILNPYEKPIGDLKAAFTEIDNKKCVVIDIVSGLVIKAKYTHRNCDIGKLIKSYFTTVDEHTISKINDKIQERERQINEN
jgi:hypothetical protein